MRKKRYISTCLLIVTIVVLLFTHTVACADTKRGIAGGQSARDNAMNSRWIYNWKADPASINGLVEGEFHGEYVPMIWSGNPGNVQGRINDILGYKDQYNVQYVLGFNEPNLHDQANMSVQQALDTWDVLTDGFAGSGLKLVSPSVSGMGYAPLTDWLYPFMDEVVIRNNDTDAENDLQIDAIAHHHYTVGFNAANEAATLLARIDEIWNRYQKPIWLTEFAGTSVTGVHDLEQRVQFNTDFLEILIPAFESRPYVERYSWWQFGAAGKPYSALSTSNNGVFTPTSIGDVYVGTLHAGESYDFASGVKQATDVHYLRGATLTNTGAANSSALRAIDALEGTNGISGTADWGLSGGSDAFMRVRSGATLEKQGANTISLLNVPFTNDGTFLATAGTVRLQNTSIANAGTMRATTGTLSLENGTEVNGAGTLHLDAGGTIAFGANADTNGSAIRQAFELNGGTVQINPITGGSHVITGTSTVQSTTTFSGDGDLFITGTLVAPEGSSGGGIIKNGAGTLLFNGNNTYNGDTVVEQGTLRLGFAGTLGNGADIDVGPDGVLDVQAKFAGYALDGKNLSLEGQVAGSVVASNGATVTVLNSSASLTGDLTVNDSRVIVGGSGFNEGGAAVPQIVSQGLELNYDAALDSANDSTWENASNLVSNLSFSGNVSPVAAPGNPPLGVSSAYDIASSGPATGLINYFQLQSPQLSQKDASFEVVFHVSDIAAGADQVLFEAGSAQGISFVLSDDTLAFNVAGDGATSTLNATLDAGWHHVVGVIDLMGTDDNLANDSLELFVDNVSIGTIKNVLINDWANGSLIGVGGDALGTVGVTSPADYHGAIASARYYDDVVFSAAEVQQNFASLFGIGEVSATTMHVGGEYTQAVSGTLEIDLLSPEMHDVLKVMGIASLSGSLDVSAISGFAPSVGDEYIVLTADGGITGAFDSLLLPELEDDMFFVVDYEANAVVLTVSDLAGDFDSDGDVDEDDLSIWLSSHGDSALADADGDGDTDGVDFLTWQQEYTGNQGSVAASAVVPEPTTLVLLLSSGVWFFGQHMRK